MSINPDHKRCPLCPAAEPADAGRDAVAWVSANDCMFTTQWRATTPILYSSKDAAENLIPLYTRPPSEADAGLTKTAIEDIMAKHLGRSSRLYLYMQADIRAALASQQAVKS